MFPVRWKKWKRSREVFHDNLSLLQNFEQQFSHHPGGYRATYKGGKYASPVHTQEGKLAEDLLTYVQEKEYTDDEPCVKIQKRNSGKVILTVRCTWYEHHVFYLVPEERKNLFENFRFHKAVALFHNWYVLEGFKL